MVAIGLGPTVSTAMVRRLFRSLRHALLQGRDALFQVGDLAILDAQLQDIPGSAPPDRGGRVAGRVDFNAYEQTAARM
jgi:hypothetical protein